VSKTRWILLIVVAAFVVQAFVLYQGLPDVVATHFDGAGNPNGWMTRGLFFVFEAGLLILVVGEFMMVPRFISRMPRSLINMPNKDYWLSPEHRQETSQIIRSYFEVFGAVVVLLFIVVNQFVYKANIDRANLPPTMWVVMVAFLVFVAIWVVKLIREFTKIK
jgi:uncharacterized membrane protein